MSNSVQPHRRQPTRLPHPWDSQGKNTGVGCLQGMKVKSYHTLKQFISIGTYALLGYEGKNYFCFSFITQGLAKCPAVVQSLGCAQLLCDLMDCSPPVSSVHGISQARILEWVAMPFSKGIFPTQGPSLASPELADGFFTPDHLGSPHALISIS